MSLDAFQQVFALSCASGAVNNDKGRQKSLQEQLQFQLNSTLPLVGDWKLVWGPVVWKHEPEDADTGPDNSWYIAYHPNLQYEDGSVHPTYVIAIAGTPLKSLYVWAQENFAVNTVCNFNAWVAGGIQNPPFSSVNIVPGGAHIATGTVNTTHLLLTTATPENAASPGTTLLDFLTTAIDPSVSPRFISTGHSLGGALSPSLALALVTAGAIPADRTLTYPTAGPSPGDVGFTELFAETFPPRKSPGAASYQGWNLNLVNTLDPVPQAWAIDESISPKQNLLNIPVLYGKPILGEVQLTIWLGAIWSRSSGALYKPIPSQYFTGTPPPSAPTNLIEFLGIVGREHVDAYTAEVGIPVPPSEESQVLHAGLTFKTAREERYNFPVIIDFEWALDHPKQAHEIQDKVQATVEANAYLSGLCGLGGSGGSGRLGGLGGLGKLI